MNTEKIIYEVLIRYGKNGEVQGMHVVYAFVVKDVSGKIIAYNVGSPEAVTLGIEQGLNLSEVLGDLNALNVVNIESLTNQLSQANAQVQSLVADKSTLISENENLIELLEQKNQRISELESLIDAENAKPAENETGEVVSAEEKSND